MTVFRIRPEHREPEFGDLESRLRDLRDAMLRASRARHDEAAQRIFLETLFADAGVSPACFTAVVEVRDVPG
ncbi:hypothetical protein [Amycolatopsis sp. NPDC003861]